MLVHLFKLHSAPAIRFSNQPEAKKWAFIPGLSVLSLTRQIGARKGTSGRKRKSAGELALKRCQPWTLGQGCPLSSCFQGRGRNTPPQQLTSSNLSLPSLKKDGYQKQQPLAFFYYKPAVYNNVGERPLEVRYKTSRVTEACFASF